MNQECQELRERFAIAHAELSQKDQRLNGLGNVELLIEAERKSKEELAQMLRKTSNKLEELQQTNSIIPELEMKIQLSAAEHERMLAVISGCQRNYRDLSDRYEKQSEENVRLRLLEDEHGKLHSDYSSLVKQHEKTQV